MKTKFIKVSTADRLPENEGWHFVIQHDERRTNAFYMPEYNKFYGFSDIEYWLLEVPDYEEEMKEVINELISELDPATLSGNYQEAIDKANSLLTKLKTES